MQESRPPNPKPEPQAEPLKVFCPDCHQEGLPMKRRTFLGFPRYVCPQCREELIGPLTPGYRVFHLGCAGVAVLLVFTLGALVTTVSALFSGNRQFSDSCGTLVGQLLFYLFPILAVYAVFKDIALRRESRAAAQKREGS